MLKNLINKYNELDIFDVNNLVIILCFFLFIISLIFGNNIYMFILMYFMLLFLSKYFSNKIVVFFISTLPLLIMGSIILQFFSFNILKIDIIYILYILIKIWIGISYIVLIFLFLKKKKIKILKSFSKRFKYYSFKELRKRNYELFINKNKDIVDKYVKNNNINLLSDYYKVVKNSIDEKSKNELEEYVWINYLRFYKNRRDNKKEIFEFTDIIYIVFHVIILLLILVR